MGLIAACEDWARAHPARVVFPDALDQRVIEAACHLNRCGWARPTLLANPMALRDHCTTHGIGYGGLRVVDPANAPKRDVYAASLRERRPEMSDEDA